MYMKNCLGEDVLDVITCAKFQNEILGVMILFLQGDEFAIFLFIFEWALQQGVDNYRKLPKNTEG